MTDEITRRNNTRKNCNLDDLRTIATFAKNNNVTAAYIYKLIGKDRIKVVVIDDCQFIDIQKHPGLPPRKGTPKLY